MAKAVYLVTTKHNNKLFESKNRTYCTDNAFLWDILLLEGGFFQSVWSFMSINSKLNFEIPLIEYVKGRLEIKKNFEKILEWWSYPKSEDDTMDDIADMALGLIPNFSDSDRNIYKQLLTGFIRIELDDVVLLITHNWYNSGVFYEIKCTNATKYLFVENLIKIAAKIEGIAPTEIKLFLHDKDVIDDGDKDEPLKNYKIPDECISKCPNLCNAIKKGNVRTFMHDSHRAKPSFFKNVLNQGGTICKSVLEGYFKDRIPPKISVIPQKYVLIDISKTEDKEKFPCSTTEIINAIAEYQSTNKFELNAVEQNEEYENTLKDIQEQDPLPILVKGDKCLEVLQKEDGRALYLDSSVWIRYAQSEDAMQNIKDLFAECHKRIYKTANAQEMQEFRARLAKNSSLKSFVGGHYGDVIPFVFHSETEMKSLIYEDRINADKEKIGASSLKAKLSRYSGKEKGAELHWRLLIVDDNAYQDNDPEEKKVQKCEVIANVLKDDCYLACENSESAFPKCARCKNMIKEFNEKPKRDEQCFTINLECATNIEKAVDKLKKKRFDLILLDYLLGEKKNKDSRDYGTDLLKDLKKQYEDRILIKDSLSEEDAANLKEFMQAKGPFGKLWIFFISAFSNAISEKMLSEGMHYNTDYWYIARGACPTTTPELFRYNLYSLFYQQIKSITDASVVKVADDGSKADSGVVTLLDLLGHIFEEAVVTRDRAMKNFNSLLRLRAHYDILKRDYYMGGKENPDAEKNGSPLVQALFPDMKYYSNAFWEHVQHLIYLIAFGNIRQWNEMWDEYIFIKDILYKAEVENKTKDEHSTARKIEKYIIGIKNANHR